MLTEFLEKKLKRAHYKILEDGTYFGEIPGIHGVWAGAADLETCRKELAEILEEWLLLKVREKESVPGFSFDFSRRALLKYA